MPSVEEGDRDTALVRGSSDEEYIHLALLKAKEPLNDPENSHPKEQSVAVLPKAKRVWMLQYVLRRLVRRARSVHKRTSSKRPRPSSSQGKGKKAVPISDPTNL
ncbi:hypothetical protein WMY93_021580 [Mugilogobius chulae]|uniref:Uncharacterized protein n=1 Tax=Mugilogobius chulae TaxID=88201 RepID=A0AAW0NCC9_9GOBI